MWSEFVRVLRRSREISSVSSLHRVFTENDYLGMFSETKGYDDS